MPHTARIPQEGDLHAVVKIENHVFELRYGFYDELDRNSGEPCVIYPDLESEPLYTKDGSRIVSAIQSVCPHYVAPEGRTEEDSCYTCSYFPSIKDEIGICRCEKTRKMSAVSADITEEMI